MPIYEYRCPQDHTFELLQKMSAEPVADCPECGRRADRVISGAGYLPSLERGGEPPHAPRDPSRS